MVRVVPEDPLSECSRLRWWRGWVTAVLTGHFSVCFEVRVVPRDPLTGCLWVRWRRGWALITECGPSSSPLRLSCGEVV